MLDINATISDEEITEMLNDESALLEQWFETGSINLGEGDKVRLEFEGNYWPVSGTFVQTRRGTLIGDVVVLRVQVKGGTFEELAYTFAGIAAIVLEHRMETACGSFTGTGKRCGTCRFLKHLH